MEVSPVRYPLSLVLGASLTALAAPGFAETATVAPAANPLTAEWTGPYQGVVPWDAMKPELFPAAFEHAMAAYRAEVHKIRDNPAPATFANVNEAMQLAGEEMDRLYAMWGVQTSNMSSPQVQAIDRELSPKLSAFNDELFLDPRLFARYKAVYDKRASLGLTPQQLRLVERDYEGLVRRGAALDQAQRAQLTQFNQQLSVAFTAAGNNGSAITTYQYSTDGGTSFRTRQTGTTAS
jgi:peptidyl-dipeptidase Dcp